MIFECNGDGEHIAIWYGQKPCPLCASHARISELEAEAEKLRRESVRWRAMFEHAARTVGWMVDEYGLAGDEATEEIARWVELAGTEPT